jgi:hypothetical protein
LIFKKPLKLPVVGQKPVITRFGINETKLLKRNRIIIFVSVIGFVAAYDNIIANYGFRKILVNRGFADSCAVAEKAVFVVKDDVIAKDEIRNWLAVSDGDTAVVYDRVVFDL